jgi:SAM-dependent methyltransferase
MLARARSRVADADFRVGELHDLPVADASVDVVTCALALTHVPSLEPVMAEFARVLRPGGHLVVSDVHHLMVLLGSVPKVVGPHGERGMLPAYRHQAGDYLGAALGHGLALRGCVEPRLAGGDRFVDTAADPSPPAVVAASEIGDWPDWPWTLQPLVRAASGAANVDLPATVVWHFAKEEA